MLAEKKLCDDAEFVARLSFPSGFAIDFLFRLWPKVDAGLQGVTGAVLRNS